MSRLYKIEREVSETKKRCRRKEGFPVGCVRRRMVILFVALDTINEI
jgi:hypothetical protein